MRLLTATALLALSAGSALAAYIVELDAGDRMTVDSYWEEGNRIHLMRGGVDLNVPKSRIRSLKEVSGTAEAGVRRPSTTAPASAGLGSGTAEGQASREDLEAQQRRIEHHLLRVQQERFEAQARGDSPKILNRLEKEFKRTQQRRIEGMKKLGEGPAS